MGVSNVLRLLRVDDPLSRGPLLLQTQMFGPQAFLIGCQLDWGMGAGFQKTINSELELNQ